MHFFKSMLRFLMNFAQRETLNNFSLSQKNAELNLDKVFEYQEHNLQLQIGGEKWMIKILIYLIDVRKKKKGNKEMVKKKSILKVPIMYKLLQKIKREKITQLIV